MSAPSFSAEGPPTEPRDAASVILVRPGAGGEIELLLQRRHRKASFMSSAFVFPGGAAEPGEDPRTTAARELFEEAGVLLADRPVAPELAADLRRQLLDGGDFAALLAGAQLALDADCLRYFAHWVTPQAERKRFSARFFVAPLPAGQVPTIDDREAVDQLWITPGDALTRAAELSLWPPQVRTLIDLGEAAAGLDGVLALADERARSPVPVLPRVHRTDRGIALLLPWDPDYPEGDHREHALADDHPLARGPSRFVLDNGTWKNVYAADSTSAD